MGFNPSRHSRNIEAQKFFEGMKQSHEDAQAAMRKAQEDMKRWYDRKARGEVDLKEGDKVWLETTNLNIDRPSRKLSEKRLGPFEVIKKIGQTSYELKIPKTWKVRTPVFHASLLHPYTPPAFKIQREPDPPPPVVIDNAEEYIVQEIVDSRIRDKKIQYRVHWEGYDKKKDYTWEPPEHLTKVQDLLDEFHKRHPSAPHPKTIRTLRFLPNITYPAAVTTSLLSLDLVDDVIKWRSGRPP